MFKLTVATVLATAVVNLKRTVATGKVSPLASRCKAIADRIRVSKVSIYAIGDEM